MNLFKNLLLTISLLAFITQANAQVDWETCGSLPGALSGTTTTILPSATTPAPVFTANPADTNTTPSEIPNTEFLVILQDSLADDSLGNAILGASITGQVMPSTYGLTDGDTFYIAPFSYDLQQMKRIFQSVLNDTRPFIGSCCGLISGQTGLEVCDSLNAVGIFDSTDINNLNDVLIALKAFQGGSSNSVSLEGAVFALDTINSQMGLINAVGCSGGEDRVCYAASPNSNAYDYYAVQVPTSAKRIAGEENQLLVAVAPNPFSTQLSTTIHATQTSTHQLRMLDLTGKTVIEQAHDLQKGAEVINLEVGQLPAGVYFLQVSDGKNINTQKLIKR